MSLENGSTTSFLSRLPTYLVTSVTVSHYNLPALNSLTIPKQYINWRHFFLMLSVWIIQWLPWGFLPEFLWGAEILVLQAKYLVTTLAQLANRKRSYIGLDNKPLNRPFSHFRGSQKRKSPFCVNFYSGEWEMMANIIFNIVFLWRVNL